jgi:radical SAM superfamily enzyme YgiQ (UPF0313 family)
MTKVLLTTLNAKYIHTNLAIRLLYQLNKDNKGLSWKEFTIKDNFQSVAEFCSEFDVVAFSCYIWNITQTLEVTQLIKTINPNTKILLGGPEVSYEWEDVLNREDVDYIISGEGEIPFKQFLTDFPNIENVTGLIFKKDGTVIQNQSPPIFPLVELNDINPYQDDDLTALKSKVLYVETSRGCPYKCEFCLASLDNKVRYLSMERIKENLIFLMQHGKTIKFLDRTFNIKKDFTISVFDFILQHHKEGNVFQFEITADILHADIIKYINEKVPKQLFRFEIGIQSVNTATNLEVSRKQSFEKTKSIIKAIDNNIEMHLDLIVGLPYETMELTKQGFEEVFALFGPELQLGFLKFLKGTPMRDKIEKHGYSFDENPPYQIIKSNYLNESELNDLLILESALEIYWNKKRSINTLKYITKTSSIFDSLMEIGKLFQTKKNLHKHTLEDAFDVMHDWILDKYPNDFVLMQMHNIDYAIYNKIRPGNRYNHFFHIHDSKRINSIENNYQLVQKMKYGSIAINFDYELWKNETKINLDDNTLLFCYDGISLPKLIIDSSLINLPHQ